MDWLYFFLFSRCAMQLRLSSITPPIHPKFVFSLTVIELIEFIQNDQPSCPFIHPSKASSRSTNYYPMCLLNLSLGH